jgi:hypothetical protein
VDRDLSNFSLVGKKVICESLVFLEGLAFLLYRFVQQLRKLGLGEVSFGFVHGILQSSTL